MTNYRGANFEQFDTLTIFIYFIMFDFRTIFYYFIIVHLTTTYNRQYANLAYNERKILRSGLLLPTSPTHTSLIGPNLLFLV